MIVARIVSLLAKVVVAIIALAVILSLLDVRFELLHDAGAWLVGPFKGLIDIKDGDVRMIVNWGLAALAYALIAGLLLRLLAGADGHGRFGRPTVGRL